MAKFIGLTTGIVSLAGLFSTCIDAFAYVKAGQSLERNLEVVLVKLDIEKARLVSWGNTVGIVRGVSDGRSKIFDNPITEDTIRSILENIKLLLTDSRKLQDKYALQEIPESAQDIITRRFDFVSRTSLSIFRGSYNRFCNRTAQNNDRVSVARRVTWAIRDHERFTCLVTDLRILVDGLVNLTPPTLWSAAERILEDDVASLRLANLRLVEEALQDEDRYQALSDAVSEAIQATELGTIDHWLDEMNPLEAEQVPANTGPSMANTQRIPWLDHYEYCFMMHMRQCPNAVNNTLPCVSSEYSTQHGTFTAKSMLARHSMSWHPGYRIHANISLEDVSTLSLEEWKELRTSLQRHSLREGGSESGSTFHEVTLVIYCPPCTCMIDTAVELCNNIPDLQLIRRLIRVDDRLPCSCFEQPTALETLQLILDEIRYVEARLHSDYSDILRSRAEYIDRDFLESRVWALETEQSPPLPPTPTEILRQMFSGCRISDNVAGIVVLGENQDLSVLMQALMCVQGARMPQENEIYKLWCENINPLASKWGSARVATFTSKVPA